MTPNKPLLINPFHEYKDDIAEVFSSESEEEFMSKLKSFKHKYSLDKNVVFISKTIKTIMETPIKPLKQQLIRASEVNYSYYFVWKLFELVTGFINRYSLCFNIGEYKLESIKNEIVRRNDESLNSSYYNVDGCHTVVIEVKTVKLSLLEVTGAFGLSDISRATKDHVKGSFGALALIQEIGHLFEFGSLETFENVRVYFIQALGKENSFLKI
jgi:hypothetical protein